MAARGASSAVVLGVAVPKLIRDVLHPPDAPDTLTRLLETAHVYLNTAQYQLARETATFVQDEWQRKLGRVSLPLEVQVYFELFHGQVLELSGEDELALERYVRARTLGDMLPLGHTDMALPYNAVGAEFFFMQQYELALDGFLRCLNLRERILHEHIDTAAAQNNAAAAYECLGREETALALYRKALETMSAQLGNGHERTALVKQNLTVCLQKTMKDFKVPVFNPPVAFALKVGGGGGKKKGKKGKKGKKKGKKK